jgi:ketosteroid isomerase-like protein
MTLEETITAYFQAISRLDRKAYLASFSDSPQLYHLDPVGGVVRTSKQAIGEFFDQVGGLFAEVEMKAGQIYPVSPTQLALTWTATGRGRNGVAVEFHGIDVIAGDEHGKIVRLEAYWDANGTITRLMP